MARAIMEQDKYREFIASIARSGKSRTFLNSDESHALAVLVQLFQIAQHKIRIFAGCLYKHVGDQPECVVALSEFIERGGTLHILLNKFDKDCARTLNLYKRLAYYKSKGYPIVIKRTALRPYRTEDPDKKEVHFTIGDECAYRIETDVDKRTAECNFANPALAKQTAAFFDSLFDRSDSEEMDITKMFDNVPRVISKESVRRGNAALICGASRGVSVDGGNVSVRCDTVTGTYTMVFPRERVVREASKAFARIMKQR